MGKGTPFETLELPRGRQPAREEQAALSAGRVEVQKLMMQKELLLVMSHYAMPYWHIILKIDCTD